MIRRVSFIDDDFLAFGGKYVIRGESSRVILKTSVAYNWLFSLFCLNE